MIEIDGSIGEGGGQILRTSLTLSLATGKPFRITNLRAGRKRPGLLRQHLTAVQAASAISGAETKGAELHSQDLTFFPGSVTPGEYRFSIGSAGSTTLVLQTILPVLMTADSPSFLKLEGGTHNSFAPPFESLEFSFLKLINKLGPNIHTQLDRPGFFPAGGGKLRVEIHPAKTCSRLNLIDRGALQKIRACAIVSRLPRHIAERELQVIAQKLSLDPDCLEVVEETRSPGPGNVAFVEVISENVTELFTAFGRKGVSAEKVGENVALESAEYLKANVPVGSYLADQLLVPLSLGSGGSYLTMPPTDHTITNIEVIQTFLDVDISSTTKCHGNMLIAIPTGLNE